MKKFLPALCAIALLISASSCEKSTENPIETRIFKLTVASEMKQNAWHPYADLTWGFSPTSFWVKEPGDAEWRAFSNDIEEFEWEEGYEYALTVKSVRDTRIQDKGADYTLLSVDSKTRKDSEGIPQPKEHRIERMTVASKQYPTDDGRQFYGVRYGSQEPESRLNMPPLRYWGIFPGEIEGFNYESGYEYVIDISYNDATNWRGFDQLPLYTLVDEREKNPKSSADMWW